MRNVILQIDLSLDGFVASPDEGLDWVKGDEEMNHDAYELLTTVDTILLGRVAYQLMSRHWPFAATDSPTTESKITHQMNTAAKIVFSRTLDRVEWGSWENARLVKDSVAEEIATLKSLPGQNLMLYAGASIVSTFIRLDLIDDYYLRIHPVILGAGKPLLSGLNRQTLKLLSAKAYQQGVVRLHYQPAQA